MVFSLLEASLNPEVDERLETLKAMAMLDGDFRARLLEDPKATLDDIGLVVPEGVELVIHETPAGAIGLSLAAPSHATVRLTDEEIADNPAVAERIKAALGMAAFDPLFRARLIKEPAAVFAGMGLAIPEGTNLVIHDTPSGALGICIPAAAFAE